jgi:hypothetical protein
MIRMLIVDYGYGFGIRSERRLCQEVHLNLAYRWFCRLGLDGDVSSELNGDGTFKAYFGSNKVRSDVPNSLDISAGWNFLLRIIGRSRPCPTARTSYRPSRLVVVHIPGGPSCAPLPMIAICAFMPAGIDMKRSGESRLRTSRSGGKRPNNRRRGFAGFR